MGESSVDARWVVTEFRESDRPVWQQLYQGYGDFYEVEMPLPKLELVWSWLRDPAHPVSGLAVRAAADADPVGLAHYRPFARPLHGSTGCYLDDLFVSRDSRGNGAVDALLARLASLAGENDWDVVRWITRSGNARARSTYDRLATQTDLITYDLPPA